MQIEIDTSTKLATQTGRWIFRATETATVTRKDAGTWAAGVYTLALASAGRVFAAGSATLASPAASVSVSMNLNTVELVALFRETPANSQTLRLAFVGPSSARYIVGNAVIHDDGYLTSTLPTSATAYYTKTEVDALLAAAATRSDETPEPLGTAAAGTLNVVLFGTVADPV
jgi:hypothetical protein